MSDDSKSNSSPAPAIGDDSHEYDSSPIVIDNGSFLVKVGFADDRVPSSVFPPVVGQVRPKHRENASRDFYVGYQKKATHKLHKRRPMYDVLSDSSGTLWDDVEKLWAHAFKRELRANPEEHAILLTEAPRNSRRNREKVTQIMFESLEVPAMCLRNTAVLSCLATGRTTGVVVESGYSATYTVPVYKGRAVSQGIRQLNVAGRHLTQQLLDLLKNRMFKQGYGHPDYFDLPTEDSSIMCDLRWFKKKYAYVAEDYDTEERRFDKSKIVDFELPDGNVMELGAERIQCVEPLFNPSLLLSRRSKKIGIAEMVYHSVWRCQGRNLQREMWDNVVLGGGTMALTGIESRLANALRPPSHKVRIIEHCRKEREHSAFVGGCVLASMSDFEDMCISRDDYDEVGPEIVHQM